MSTPVKTRSINGGTQNIYRFPNGYGASIVNHSFSYGTELAVIKFNSANDEDFNIVYDTPITDDVIGHCSSNKIISLLKNISELPTKG